MLSTYSDQINHPHQVAPNAKDIQIPLLRVVYTESFSDFFLQTSFNVSLTLDIQG